MNQTTPPQPSSEHHQLLLQYFLKTQEANELQVRIKAQHKSIKKSAMYTAPENFFQIEARIKELDTERKILKKKKEEILNIEIPLLMNLNINK